MEVADNLHQLATDLWEKQQQNSKNSSQPPSKDNPYSPKKKPEPEPEHPSSESESATVKTEQKQIDKSSGEPKKQKSNRKPGKQPGGKGFGRQQPLKAKVIIPHYPHVCSACNHDLAESDAQRYMGYYVLELEPELFGFGIVTQLHHYYQTTCSCGHRTLQKPGTGWVSVVEGRSQDLQLTEYVLVGSFLATFIASLSVRYRMSRTKIQEFLKDWTNTELSTGTIDRCIREVGIACVPVVEELVAQLQQADILHQSRNPLVRKRKASLVMGSCNHENRSISYWLSSERRIILFGHRSFFGLVNQRWLCCLSFPSQKTKMFGTFDS